MKLTKAFVKDIRELIRSARATVKKGVDLVQVHTNFEIGRRIVQQEQKGQNRAAYGEEVIGALADQLSAEFGRGFSKRNLAYMRAFYLAYQDRSPIVQSMIAKSAVAPKVQSKIAKSQRSTDFQPPAGELIDAFDQTASADSLTSAESATERSGQSDNVAPRPFTLSWTH